MSRKIIFIGLLLILATTVCAYEYISKPIPSEKFVPEIYVDEVRGLSDQEIAMKLFALYLEHYKSDSVPKRERLKDYKVLDAIKTQVAEGIFYGVGYSVQTYSTPNNRWGPGNGRSGDDNWILQKSNYIRLIKEEDKYSMEMHGTGL